MKCKPFAIFISLVFLISCNTKNQFTQEQKNIDTTLIQEQTKDDKITFDLDYGFKATFGNADGYDGDWFNFLYFELSRNGKIIIIDTVSEYWGDTNPYPIILQTGNNRFELLFEMNGRPNRNFAKRFFVSTDKLIKEEELPLFISKPKDINGDGILEYAGFWYYSETWGNDYNLTAYNPILYYSVTETGLKLDSTLTKERNEKIYGQFYGFKFSEEIEQPTSVIKEFDKEIEFIKNHK